VAGGSIAALLHDPEREVRIAAARALATLGYTAARPALEAAIDSKQLRAADRTEKIAFFESFGTLGGAEGATTLARMLNSRGWLGRGESPEIRACAALGLARSNHPTARTALTRAAEDPDPVVKNAVARALREAAS
jgi:HEAT repeat protein